MACIAQEKAETMACIHIELAHVKNIAAQLIKMKTAGEVFTTFSDEKKELLPADEAKALADPTDNEGWYAISGCE